MDCERCILRDNKHNSQGEIGRNGGRRASKCPRSRYAETERWEREREYPAGFYHRALHCSLTISSSFLGRGDGRTGTNGRRKSCGTCRCSRRPCHRTWKTPITRRSLKRRSSLSLAKTERRGREEVIGSQRETTAWRGCPSRFHVKEENSCGRICGAFPREADDSLFFYYPSLCSCPSIPLSLSRFLASSLDRE